MYNRDPKTSDAYQKVKEKLSKSTNENQIRVSAKYNRIYYIAQATSKLHEKNRTLPLIIVGASKAIPDALQITQFLRERIPNLHAIIEIKSTITVDIYYPLEEGLDTLKIDRFLPLVEITLSLSPLDTNNPGYHGPLPNASPLSAEEIEKFAKIGGGAPRKKFQNQNQNKKMSSGTGKVRRRPARMNQNNSKRNEPRRKVTDSHYDRNQQTNYKSQHERAQEQGSKTGSRYNHYDNEPTNHRNRYPNEKYNNYESRGQIRNENNKTYENRNSHNMSDRDYRNRQNMSDRDYKNRQNMNDRDYRNRQNLNDRDYKNRQEENLERKNYYDNNKNQPSRKRSSSGHQRNDPRDRYPTQGNDRQRNQDYDNRRRNHSNERYQDKRGDFHNQNKSVYKQANNLQEDRDFNQYDKNHRRQDIRGENYEEHSTRIHKQGRNQDETQRFGTQRREYQNVTQENSRFQNNQKRSYDDDDDESPIIYDKDESKKNGRYNQGREVVYRGSVNRYSNRGRR